MKKADQQRIDMFRKVGCIACRVIGHFNDQYDVHHIVDSGYREHSGGDAATLPLCPWHHRGVSPISGVDPTELYGPSLAQNKRAFTAKFGNERQLLEQVNTLITKLGAKT